MPQIGEVNETASWAPCVVTPEQYDDGRRSDGAMLPIKQLMRAVLEDALRCWELCGAPRTGQRRVRFAEIETWIFERSSDGPFAFTTICETLGIAPGPLRKALCEWRQQQLSGTRSRILWKRSYMGRSGRIRLTVEHRRTRRLCSSASSTG